MRGKANICFSLSPAGVEYAAGVGPSMIPEKNARATTGEAPCGAHVFEGFFGLENGPVKSDKSQEKTLFGKEMPEDASRHPKPTSYPQTRQDTVVRVFPMESSN